MSSTSGWILDAHLCSAQLEMLVWIVTEEGSVVSFREPWHPTLHVAGSSSDLDHLVEWLSQPEIWIRYGLQRYAFERKRPELGSFDTEHMLALTLESCATLRALAEHIDARGEHVRYTLYSVDVRAEQQYLTSKRLTIGSPVCLENNPDKYKHSQLHHRFGAQSESSLPQAFFSFTLKKPINDNADAFAISVIQQGPRLKNYRQVQQDKLFHESNFNIILMTENGEFVHARYGKRFTFSLVNTKERI